MLYQSELSFFIYHHYRFNLLHIYSYIRHRQITLFGTGMWTILSGSVQVYNAETCINYMWKGHTWWWHHEIQNIYQKVDLTCSWVFQWWDPFNNKICSFLFVIPQLKKSFTNFSCVRCMIQKQFWQCWIVIIFCIAFETCDLLSNRAFIFYHHVNV